MAITTLCQGIFSLLLFAGCCFADHDWSYKGKSGPTHWHEMFPEACSGKLQSPINIIPEETMYDPKLKEFAIWYDPPRPNSKMNVKNNGHTVQINTVGDFYITNGGLEHVYKTAQFHFHWGQANHQGSEHYIEGQAYPLEMHVVNYNHDLYSDITEAVTRPMGLAVLGVLFEISDKENKALKPILKAIRKVKDPEKEDAREIKPMSIRDVLPADINRYYRYNGSLTTPGCFESVIWTVFERKQTISLDQMLEFRQILKHKRTPKKKGQHKKHGHRSKRSKSKKMKAEEDAEKVIDELGIRGDPVQETELKALMEERKLDKEMAAAITDSYSTKPVLDEQLAKQAEENMMQHILEKEKESMEHATIHPERERGLYNVDSEPGMVDVQERLVNNFRPLQPRNDRNIYRSFKLSASPPVQYTNAGMTVGYTKSSAKTISVSFGTLTAVLMYTLYTLC
ncbi:carbonic anhydrase 14-like [Gigantopelta aegis]|uniref:carbonic anhydrase 14-like n=1 Tax=Gigantopelta aegis TaxID=1735272 RepID=UPI001B88B0BD|nr:carbonic anhydrase 14-like [Gigantopelta aegis]